MFKVVTVVDVSFSCLFLLILTVVRTMRLVWLNTFVTKLIISRAFLGKKHHICIRERLVQVARTEVRRKSRLFGPC